MAKVSKFIPELQYEDCCAHCPIGLPIQQEITVKGAHFLQEDAPDAKELAGQIS
jgi:hypothetical protein